MTEMARRYMGNSVPRKEDPTLLTGRSNFTDDIRLPGMLHMAFLRSPYAHARITSIDASAAREQPGVVAVFTSEDLADVLDGSAMDADSAPGYAVDIDESPESEADVTPNGSEESADVSESSPRTFCGWPVTENIKIPHHSPLARGEVNFAGEPVAVVLATDRYKAQDALEFIEVDYEPMGAATDIEAALEDGVPLVHEEFGSNECYVWTLATGDIDEAFEKADVVVSERYIQQRLIPSAIETRAVVAQPEPLDSFTVYSSTQVPHFVKDVLSVMCGVPDTKLRVVAPDVGGGVRFQAECVFGRGAGAGGGAQARSPSEVGGGPLREPPGDDPRPGTGPVYRARRDERGQDPRDEGQAPGRYGRLPAAPNARRRHLRLLHLPRPLRLRRLLLRVHRGLY